MLLNVIFLIGAICVALFPFDRSRIRAPWARWAFFTIAALTLFMGISGVGADLRLWPSPNYSGGHLSAIRGFILGLFFALIVSGQLRGRKASQ